MSQSIRGDLAAKRHAPVTLDNFDPLALLRMQEAVHFFHVQLFRLWV